MWGFSPNFNKIQMTKIIATLGPSCDTTATLKHFKENNVAIIRQNLSHSSVDWHLEMSHIVKSVNLPILLDCPGPKIRLGEMIKSIDIKAGEKIILEYQKEDVYYPYQEGSNWVFPSHFETHKHVKTNATILVDDGKLEWHVDSVIGERVLLTVVFGGSVKSRKGMNMPGTFLDIEFLTERDKLFLNSLLVQVKPEYVAVSFVKDIKDFNIFHSYLKSILDDQKITNYFPKICIKFEMGTAVDQKMLPKLIEKCDIAMVARGDLALEMKPLHVRVPFVQEMIKQECLKQNKPFIIATQILESMMDSPVPTRAEVSDLYRAVVLDRANFIMCSGETAAGKYPIQSINFMRSMILESEKLPENTHHDLSVNLNWDMKKDSKLKNVF